MGAFDWEERDNLIERFIDKDRKRFVVFEGAQGLLLDQSRIEYMPFLTRSNTGLKNIFQILRTIKKEIDLDVFLVSRTYLTRHGEGPLFNEIELPYKNINELTNPENQFQGKMRYGVLDKKWYHKAIEETKNTKMYDNDFHVAVALTCTDHVPMDWQSDVKIISNGPMEKDIIYQKSS